MEALDAPQVPGNTSGDLPEGGTNKRKRINAGVHWCFTLNNPLSADRAQLEELFRRSCKKFVFQLEAGEAGTPHYQGYISLLVAGRPMSVFPRWPSVHWECCRDPKASIVYCQKEEGRIEGPWSNLPVQRFGLRLIESEDLYQWQHDVIEWLPDVPHNRKIWWLWDPIGGTGKTQFCRYLMHHHDAIKLSAKSGDMKYGVIKYHEENGVWPYLILVDIPRSILDFVSYAGIEEVKDGAFFSSKFAGESVLMPQPHVIIFANTVPPLGKMSEDRFIVRKIPGEDDLYSYEDVVDLTEDGL